jgi:hypothetical protein
MMLGRQGGNFINTQYLGNLPGGFEPMSNRVVLLGANDFGDGTCTVQIQRSDLALHIYDQSNSTSPFLFCEGSFHIGAPWP